MTVEKVVMSKEKTELGILQASLLSAEEAKTLLTQEERAYKRVYWLLTPGDYSHYACFVGHNGGVCDDYVNYDYAVRPTLVLPDIADTNWSVGDIFEIAEYKFKILTPTLAWMYKQDIGCHCFDEETNIYEDSSIKKFVDEWFDNLIKED